MQTNERNESNVNEYNDINNAFYLAVSHHGTALITKLARKPEVVSNPVAARTAVVCYYSRVTLSLQVVINSDIEFAECLVWNFLRTNC